MTRLLYPVLIEPLSAEDGGGFLARVPDLPGCMSDGESPEEVIGDVCDAIATWIDMATELAMPFLNLRRRSHAPAEARPHCAGPWLTHNPWR